MSTSQTTEKQEAIYWARAFKYKFQANCGTYYQNTIMRSTKDRGTEDRTSIRKLDFQLSVSSCPHLSQHTNHFKASKKLND